MTLKSAQIPDTSVFAWNVSQRILILPLFTLLHLQIWHYEQSEFTHRKIITFTSVNFLDQTASSSNAMLTVVSKLPAMWSS